MTIADIIALAKQGFKPGDIKEIIELAKTVPEPEPFNPPAKDPEPVPEPEIKTDPEPQPDLAAELEKLKAENEKMKTDLLAAQEENRRQPNPEIPQQTLDEKLTDIARAFMR